MGSVAIRNNDEIIFENTYGYADVKNKIKADNQTRYKIGSITKTFTSVVILQLIEEKN